MATVIASARRARRIGLGAIALAALWGAAAPAEATISLTWSFISQFSSTGDTYQTYSGRIDNIADDGNGSNAYATVLSSPSLDDLAGGPYAAENNGRPAQYVFASDGTVTDSFNYFMRSDGATLQLANGQLGVPGGATPAFLRTSDFSQFAGAVSDPTFSKAMTGGGPSAPGPLLGLGLVPAMASFGGLAFTRLRRRKTARA